MSESVEDNQTNQPQTEQPSELSSLDATSGIKETTLTVEPTSESETTPTSTVPAKPQGLPAPEPATTALEPVPESVSEPEQKSEPDTLTEPDLSVPPPLPPAHSPTVDSQSGEVAAIESAPSLLAEDAPIAQLSAISTDTQGFTESFSQATADDIQALAKALTTPLSHEGVHDQFAAATAAAAAAAVVAVAAATVAATQQHITALPGVGSHQDHSNGQTIVEHPQPQDTVMSAPPTFDVDQVYNQVMSLNSQSEKAEGKKTAQEVFDQNQAARALQLIAQSLDTSTASQTIGLDHTSGAKADDANDTAVKNPMEIDQHVVNAASMSDTLLSISQAISFPSQQIIETKIADDTHAFAQAIMNATKAEAAKAAAKAQESQSETSGLDHTALQSLSLNGEHHTAIGTNSNVDGQEDPSAAGSGSSGQGFTFEVDKATGKTHIKWTPDPGLNATAIQQALHTLITSTGIPSLAELGVTNGPLMVPPIGSFPAQGSDFGATHDSIPGSTTTDPSGQAGLNPPARKKRKTGVNSGSQQAVANIPEGAPTFPCTFHGCDKVFARLYNLKSHSRTHTNERPYICSHCQLAFARNHDLKRHTKIHGGGKAFVCSGCAKSFSRLDALGRHRANSKNRPGCQLPESSSS
ncbi:hypothetical protein BGW38_005647 [Lunasporangiospora selenospora]|uniref:C2H2-type domain-containing protein n=1 Tax=Lunasporangiospora selenospora TaxID=979761 RepID=A0A9P6FZX7_9FUNG|nr:hypothetical protein BGW38_005647 [Lunasporangiospora selenospora]